VFEGQGWVELPQWGGANFQTTTLYSLITHLTTNPPSPGLELGGLAGSTVAGLLSDLSIRKAAAKGSPGGNVGRRIRVVMLYTAGMAAMLLALQAAPAGNTALQWLIIAGLGFTIYGPQMWVAGGWGGDWLVGWYGQVA
jgi:hypothetical protein